MPAALTTTQHLAPAIAIIQADTRGLHATDYRELLVSALDARHGCGRFAPAERLAFAAALNNPANASDGPELRALWQHYAHEAQTR